MIPEGDMSGLLAQAQAMQEQLFTAQQELADDAGRGLGRRRPGHRDGHRRR